MAVRFRHRPAGWIAALLILVVFATVVAFGGSARSESLSHLSRKNAVSTILGDSTAGWTSGNWSGYAVTAGGYSQVSATWTVPTPGATSSPTYSAFWIGIDGFANNSLIQIGTEHDYTGNGAQYYAWWEVLPSAEARISSLAVRGGDKMSATIARQSGSAWKLTLSNQTTGQSFSTTQTYNGPMASAEWIVEAPAVGNQATTLAQYGQTSFASASVNGASPSLTRGQGGTMVQQGQQVSTPSDPSWSGSSFTMAYGSIKPASPFL